MPPKKKTKKNKFNNSVCENNMKYEECELAILRKAVDVNEEAQKLLKIEKRMNGEELDKIFAILEEFIVKKKLILYGGFAINALLPTYAQFYDKRYDIPDYDCYSSSAMEDAIELANIYFEKGYKEVEARAGVHFGTYKVFVNFVGVADITLLENPIFKNLQTEAIVLNGIKYCPINFLRRNMFKELCEPLGDVTRWEKVLKRLTLLNEIYPMNAEFSDSIKNCENIEFQRKMETNVEKSEQIYNIMRDAFIFMGAVFFGGYACSLYSEYMPEKNRRIVEKIPDFDVLCDDIDKSAKIVKEKLEFEGFDNIKIIKHGMIGEIIPEHIEIKIGRESLAFIYKPASCYSFNTINVKEKKINVATIDTILYFYLSFYYSDQPYYNKDRIICMVKILFDVQQENRLNQVGLLKRFNTQCVGVQKTIDEIRKIRTMKFKELYEYPNSLEYKKWFLKYNPFNKNKFKTSTVAPHFGKSFKIKRKRMQKTRKNRFQKRDNRRDWDNSRSEKNVFKW